MSADSVPVGVRFPELAAYVEDAHASFAAAVEAAGRGAWEMVDFHLMLLEMAAEQMTKQCHIEINAHYPGSGF